MTAVRLATVVALAIPVIGHAQAPGGTPLVSGRSYRIPSKVLGEARAIDVSLPVEYDSTSAQRYPVIYVLDGEALGEPVVAVTRFFAANGQMPAAIVVGVRSTARTRDFTPEPVAGFTVPPEAGEAGGAAGFLDFLSSELVPWVDRRYHTAPMRVLIGHSLGGLFALDVLATRPAAFAGYVVMEPATWWNNGRELADVAAALETPASRRLRLVLVNAAPIATDTTGWGGDVPMVRQLRVRGETHTGMALPGVMAALRTMFADFRAPQWMPGTQPIAMLEHYDQLSRRLGFAVPIPAQTFEEVFRMSVDARDFAGAARVLDRVAREQPSMDITGMRQQLTAAQAEPAPAGLVPLLIPAARPSPVRAASYLGLWVASGHEVEIRASGDTIVVHERVRLPHGEWTDDDVPVIGMTADGQLEWGQRVFRGLAALLVLRGKIETDGSMTTTREVRGWVPPDPTGDMLRAERFQRSR